MHSFFDIRMQIICVKDVAYFLMTTKTQKKGVQMRRYWIWRSSELGHACHCDRRFSGHVVQKVHLWSSGELILEDALSLRLK